jgi:hypothetical protein
MNDPSGVQSATVPAAPEDPVQPPELAPEAEIVIARRLRGSELALQSARLREADARATAARLAQRIGELAAAAAQAARIRAQREVGEAVRNGTRAVPSPPPPPHADVSTGEGPVAGQPPAGGGAGVPQATIDALRREVETRAATEARLRAELVTTHGKLEARLAIESSLSLTLSELRAELEQLRSAVALEGVARVAGLSPAGGSATASGLPPAGGSATASGLPPAGGSATASGLPPAGGSATASGSPPAGGSARPLQPQRLSEALSRLRETIPAQEEAQLDQAVPGAAPEDRPALAETAGAAPEAGAEAAEPAAAGRAWLEPVFRSLVRRDAAVAGRLLLDLLPAQRVAYPRPVAYDLALGEHHCVQVTVFAGPPEIRFGDAPRPASVTDFRVLGDAARLARLLTVGRIRARLGIGVARVRGRRESLSALRALVQAPLLLSDLQGVGVRLEPALALEVAALMIAPHWTAGERFSIAHEQQGRRTSLLHVRDGLAVAVSEAWPADRADTTIACPAELLLDVLSGHDPRELEIRGDERRLGLLRDWLKRAQSG